MSRTSPKKLTMTAWKYDEYEDFVNRKVNIQVLQGKLLHNVQFAPFMAAWPLRKLHIFMLTLARLSWLQ